MSDSINCPACGESVQKPHQCPAASGRHIVFDEDTDWTNRKFRDQISGEWRKMPDNWTKEA